MGCCPLTFLLLSNPGAGSNASESGLDARASFRICLGFRRQGLDMPNSEQALAIKTDQRVLSEGSMH
jgi:hypothetical protein